MRLFIAQISDFFLPRLCCHCSQKLLSTEHILCKLCYSEINHNPPELLESEFTRKFKEEKIIENFFSLYSFPPGSPLQSAVHCLKYNHNIKVGLTFGSKAARYFQEELTNWNIDFIVPIPLHPVKKAERGYNQSFYFAKGVSGILNIPVFDNIIKRVKNTPSQTKLDLVERKQNMDNAFSCIRNKKIKNKNFLIVDDVITTGATVNECGKILIQNGAKKIFALSIGLAE